MVRGQTESTRPKSPLTVTSVLSLGRVDVLRTEVMVLGVWLNGFVHFGIWSAFLHLGCRAKTDHGHV
jgi:hypothetical protein